jgi:hypothetical protein
MATVPITNPGGEAGDLTGWTVGAGTAWASAASLGGISPHSGTRLIRIDQGGSPSGDLTLFQDCPVDSGDEADIDAGRAELTLTAWVATAASGNDRGRVSLEFRDGLGASIFGFASVSTPSRSPGTGWIEHTDTYRVPPGTRTIRITLIAFRTSGTGCQVAFDDLALTIAQAADRTEGSFPHDLKVQNPGGEFGYGNSFAAGNPLVWQIVAGEPANRSDASTPISGSWVLSGFGNFDPTSEMEQLIDLWAEQLAPYDGRIVLRFQSFVSTSGDDFGRLGMRFYDEDLALLDDQADDRFDSAADMDDNVWSQAVMFRAVPTGTRFVGIWLRCDNNGGSQNIFCWDDVGLTAYIVDDAGDFLALGQFHTSFNATTVTTGADEKHGAVHTVGLNGMEVFRLGFFADAATAASVRGVIYEVDGSNDPTSLVAESDEIAAVVRGWNELTFGAPPTLAAGSSYWLGFHTDAALTYRPGRHGAVPAASSSGADAYADGASDPFGSPSALGNALPVYVLAEQAAGGAVGDSGKRSIVIAITC